MIVQHLRHGARGLSRQPGFTATADFVLAFGVSALDPMTLG
jgi:hypothetical protein